MKCLQFLFCLQKSLFWQCMAFCNLKVYLLQLVFISHRDLINICDHEKWLYVVFQIRRKKNTQHFLRLKLMKRSTWFMAVPSFCCCCFLEDKSPCHLEDEPGPCRGLVPRFFFDFKSQECKRFFYGGCFGNANNFKTIKECHERCQRMYQQLNISLLCNFQ